jgi:hypothetical protein
MFATYPELNFFLKPEMGRKLFIVIRMGLLWLVCALSPQNSGTGRLVPSVVMLR